MSEWERFKEWWFERPVVLAFALAVVWVIIAVILFFAHWLAGMVWVFGWLAVGLLTMIFYTIIDG